MAAAWGLEVADRRDSVGSSPTWDAAHGDRHGSENARDRRRPLPHRLLSGPLCGFASLLCGVSMLVLRPASRC